MRSQRIFIGIVTGVLALATAAGAPTMGPILVGIGCGLVWQRQALRVAALSSLLAWTGLLIIAGLRGHAIGEVPAKLGSIMGVPGVVFIAITLLYPVVLASSAAWLARLVSPFQDMSETDSQPA